MTERRHNKMYREIEGYEDALYYVSDLVDELDEVKDKLRYGYPKEEVMKSIHKAQKYMDSVLRNVSAGGHKIEE